MPKPVNGNAVPEKLRPYLFHGVDISANGSSQEAVGECPFCSKTKFYVSLETGLWQCKVCGVGSDKGGGNVYTFLRELWKVSFAATNGASKELAADRGLMYPETLTAWEVAQSVIDGEWLLPGYGVDGRLSQLYRYVRSGKDGKRLLLATPGTSHGLHGVHLYDADKPDVALCEGPWDAKALWESLRYTKLIDGGYDATGNEASSLLKRVNVLAAPGCNVFQESWLPLFAGKNVIIYYDADDAGWKGAQRVTRMMASAEQPPMSLQVVRWEVDRPQGYDVRDLLAGYGDTPAERAVAVGHLLSLVQLIPEDWVKGRSRSTSKAGGLIVEPLKCESWKVLINAWRKAMKWPPSGTGLDGALACMLAAVVSTDASGSQLWFKIIGPPASGKSTVCEAISVCKKYIFANSEMTGIHSGWKTDAKGEEDHSLIPKVKDKTLVIKDGDGLLRATNRDRILAQLRDLYDRTSRMHYGHGVSRVYENIALTILLCGTDTLRVLDRSELGARFLDYVIMEGIEEDEEDDIVRRVVNRTFDNLAGGREAAVGHDDAAMLEAKRLTGGYVSYLRENADRLISAVATETIRSESERILYLESLGKFVAFARSRPSKEHEEVAERELGSRLSEQFARLGVCLAVVLNRDRVDAETASRVRKVGMDTARGPVLKAFDGLSKVGDDGAENRQIAGWITATELKAGELLRFLRKIDAVERFDPEHVPGVKGRPRFRLTARLTKIYDEVHAVE